MMFIFRMWLFSSDGFSCKGNDGHIQKNILRVSFGVGSRSGEWVQVLLLVNCGDDGQRVRLRMLFQVSYWWRLLPGVLAAEEECEWQPGADTEQQPGHSAQCLWRTTLLIPSLSLWAHSDTGLCSRCWATAGWMLLLCTSPTVLLTYFNSLLFRVWLWNLPRWIQISKTCWKISQLESFAGKAFSDLCSGNGLSGSFSFFFFSVLLLKNSTSSVLCTEGSGATATEQRWIDVVRENP